MYRRTPSLGRVSQIEVPLTRVALGIDSGVHSSLWNTQRHGGTVVNGIISSVNHVQRNSECSDVERERR